jgi:hypothetical protein
MDTKEDFEFLHAYVAEKFNPYDEGEYIVIQTWSKSIRLRALHRGFDYRAAKSFCELENLGSDYNHYSLRIVYQGKLHHVDFDGAPTIKSREQDWKVAADYLQVHYDRNLDGEIEVCNCSYPVFWALKTYINQHGEGADKLIPVTCLIEDHGRDIDCCPNCSARLIEEEDDSEDIWEEAPDTCKGCKYYSDNYFVPCAVRPYGPDDAICPDYSM